MYNETAKFVRACFECQARDPVRLHEPAGSARPMRIWEKWYIDTTPLPNEEGQKGVIQARDSASGWLEARILQKVDGKSATRFVWEDIICRHGVPQEIVIDFGPEMRSEMRNFLKSYHVDAISISVYNPQANRAIKRVIRTLKDALSKIINRYKLSEGIKLK